jgi:hypothetical protein
MGLSGARERDWHYWQSIKPDERRTCDITTMSYLVIENFQAGLDTRKAELAAPAGTLTEGVDGHITPGGEFEKRKAFFPLENPDVAETDSLPPSTFGLQPVAGGLMVFGSDAQSGAQWPDDADGNAVTYQRLQHPAVLAGETYSAGSHAMTAVIHSEVYGGLAFVIAEYADGHRFGYYDGSLVDDFTAGLILPYLAGQANNPKIAAHIEGLIDQLANYSAALVGPYATTNRSHSGTQATLTIGTHTLNIDDKVYVTGIATSGYNVTGAAIVAKTATTITYNTGTTLTEGTTAETGGTVKTGLLDIDGPVGVPFTLSADAESAAGSVNTPENTISPVTPVEGAEAVGAFSITGGTDDGVTPVISTGSVNSTATNAAAGEWVQIGKKKYTFRTAGTMAVEGDVKIGANAAATLANLKSAINHTGTAGTDYICSWAHPWVYAGTITGSPGVLPLKAYAGSHGNSIPLKTTAATSLWTVTGLAAGSTDTKMTAAGVGNCIGSVKVVSPAGVETELLAVSGGSPTPIRFQINTSATAAQVRDAITANAGVSGYTATINENRVTILSSDAASPMPNGYHLQIASGGNVLVGECMFYLNQQAAAFGLNTILVDGLDCLAGAEAFPQTGSTGVAVDTLPEYYDELAYIINSRAGITGISAWTDGSMVKLSQITTRDDDSPLAVYVTPTVATPVGVGIVFGEPPPLTLPLSVVLPEFVSFPNTDGIALSGYVIYSDAAHNNPCYVYGLLAQTVLTPISVTGGNGLFTYEWIKEPALDAIVLHQTVFKNGNNATGNVSGACNIIFETSPANSRVVNIACKSYINFNQSGVVTFISQDILSTGRFFSYWRLKVTDSAGNTAVSNPCLVEFNIT